MFYRRKRLFNKFLFIVGIAVVLLACSKSKSSDQVSNEAITVSYTESADDFANPERGFYRYTETRAGSYTPLAQSQLQQWRGLNPADGGNYQVYSTLIFRYFIMDIFKNSALSASFL